MVSTISKKYTKALIASQDDKGLLESYEALSNIGMALTTPKLQDILGAKEITNEQKAKLLIEISGSDNVKLSNFIHLLLKTKRVDIAMSVAEEIRKFLAAKSGKARGVAVASFYVEESDLSQIAVALGAKLQREIELSFYKTDSSRFNGIKVEIDDLGVEVEINKDALKNSIITHILNTTKIF